MAATAQERKRRFWNTQVRAWERSGLTQAAFCRQRGLSRSLFGYWKHQLARVEGPGSGHRDEQSAVELVPVEPGAVAAAIGEEPVAYPWRAALSVLVGPRYRVEVREGFEPSTLARVLRTLEAL